MSRRRRKSAPIGLPPGTLLIDPEAPPPVVHFMGFGPDELEEGTVEDISVLEGLRGRWPVLWLNINGLGDEAVLRKVAEVFKLHKLALEDVVNTNQRPKVEAWPESTYIVLRSLTWGKVGEKLDHEQISLFVGPDFVLTVQERIGDPFEPVRKRIRDRRPAMVQGGPDYLGYALIDALVDGYFPVIQEFSDLLDDFEEEVDERPTRSLHTRIRTARRAHILLRRNLWPARDVLQRLQNSDLPFFSTDVQVYLRDVYDHALRVLDLVESQRDQVSGLSEAYMTVVSFRTNEVMSMLTLVGTIFMPLSFLAGIYGMNFDTASPYNLPELGFRYGYITLLSVMAVTAVAMMVYFRRRGWLGGEP
ncbi:MAG: magnesium/cobalt transporter CorA [Deltaproteobacteria bacterium]|nr:MAG: magnesium/cobalt transporter CorA [Deltaproteobacteria bacterium]